ncbi:MAG: hypothetical protein ACXIVF_00015 [Rhizobiaceae bacterium]
MTVVLDQARDVARANVSDTPDATETLKAIVDIDRLFVDLAVARTLGLIQEEPIHQLEFGIAMGRLDEAALLNEAAVLLADGGAPELALGEISKVFEPGDVIEIRCLDPYGERPAEIYCGRLDVLAERARMIAMIRAGIRAWRNLYFGINPRRVELAGTRQPASASAVWARRSVVLDLDLKDAPDTDPNWASTRRALRQLKPILELNSGNGFHFWFRIEDVEEADVAATTLPLARAMARLGADNMADPPRITRMPYSLNFPSKPKQKRGGVVRLALPVKE